MLLEELMEGIDSRTRTPNLEVIFPVYVEAHGRQYTACSSCSYDRAFSPASSDKVKNHFTGKDSRQAGEHVHMCAPAARRPRRVLFSLKHWGQHFRSAGLTVDSLELWQSHNTSCSHIFRWTLTDPSLPTWSKYPDSRLGLQAAWMFGSFLSWKAQQNLRLYRRLAENTKIYELSVNEFNWIFIEINGSCS
ncbi:hypothetical protein E5288_WYG004913 [Bos mutus]|uniref:Uncharacterized protein n=1 Tax=Bos mutus TaxID=72004 RepID=A0A6B0R3E0_9CETA|nr:hypothetical protein [Bos mutus]